MKPIRTYAVTVDGFSPGLYSARSPSKARTLAFRQYRAYDSSIAFRGFLKISTVCRVDDPPGAGVRVKVCGKPATRVVSGGRGASNRLLFMYDDSDEILCAHPSEIETEMADA